ncbi:MAG: GFA family protein [Sphingomonadales bacterium]|nr:GFA family protein [Sphingomonadales bacterium]
MLKTYFGSCHCGDVTFAAEIDFDEGSGRCNCSICAKRRAWSVIVKPDAFRLLRGEDKLSDYQFGTSGTHHRFCARCGCAPFSDGDMPGAGGAFLSISVACLDELSEEELAAIPIAYSDGCNDVWWDKSLVMGYL